MRLKARKDGDRLLVEQSGGFNPENKVILRSIAQGAICLGGTLWSYPYSKGAVLALQQGAELMQSDLLMDSELEEAAHQAEEITGKEHQLRRLIQRYLDDAKLDLGAYTTSDNPPPWRHQRIAYHWAMRVEALYVAHKPGLGKTRTGSDIIRGRVDTGWVRWPEQFWVEDHYSEVDGRRAIPGHWATRGGVLIVAPKVVLGTWRDELARWQNVDGLILHSANKQMKYRRAGTAAWCHICTYDSLEVVEDNQYDGIVADELHYLANDDTVRWARMQHLRQSARWVLGLSGTPVSNMLPSLWAQYHWLDGGRTLGASFDDYRRRYFDGSGRRLEPRRDAEAQISQRVSRITYFLDMQTAFPDKPRKIQQIHRIDMTREQLYYYEQVRRDAIAEVQTGTVDVSDSVTNKLNKLLQICQGFVKTDDGKIQTFTSAKLDALRGMITGAGDLTDRRVIVWCRFRHDLALITEMLTKAGVPHLHLHGDLKQREREAVRDRWNHDHRYKVLVGMIQLGIGINLHAPDCVDEHGLPARCSTTVFYGLDWRVTQLEQAMDRVYRGDQVETCLYRYLLSDDLEATDSEGNPVMPLDMRVYETLQQKLEQAANVSEESVDYVRRLLAA